ncbi:hypothetical protein CC80DRAFT_593548 [Byssothecium circinans]|uniref:Rhodopsin domain-containing protein n=1 Tax=Byssothecium circinans TaxID=147558 RepID=A0A6A5U1I2_9PLEO|nr:hypothetical protein CC80DRAFT_593548 [Byssothecium circinans]
MAAHPTPEYLAEDSGPTLIAISVLFIVLDSIFVALRFYARNLNHSPIGLDDFIVPFGWFNHVGLCILGITMVYDAGVGRHLAYNMNKDPHIMVHWAKSLYALEWLYLASAALPKISICLLYLRIFNNRAAKAATHAVIWIIIANWIIFIVATSLQCRPFAYQWNKKIRGGNAVIMLLPIKTIWGLKVSRARKGGVLFIFSTGSVGIVASCIRMASFFQTDAFQDNTWASVKLVGWSIIEPGMYLAAANFVRLRPVMALVGRKLHIKDICGSFSKRRSTNNISGIKNIRLGALLSSHSGFNKIDTEAEGASTKGIMHSNV